MVDFRRSGTFRLAFVQSGCLVIETGAKLDYKSTFVNIKFHHFQQHIFSKFVLYLQNKEEHRSKFIPSTLIFCFLFCSRLGAYNPLSQSCADQG